MTHIYELEPQNPNLEPLLVNEIKELEKDLLGLTFNSHKETNKRYFNRPRPKAGDYADQLFQFAKKMSFSSSVAITSHSGEVLDSKDIIITMTPLDPSNHQPRTKQSVNIDMVGKKYAPGVAIASLDDKISFINRDSVKHNVFSSSGGNSFDLGTYGRGKSSSVQFKKAGVVKVYCNIHPDMVAFVGVSKYGYSAVTDAAGKFTVSSLPPGQYTLNMWSPRGEMTELVSVPATSNKTYTFNVASTFSSQHKNKDGKDYDESSFFDDEFY